MHDCNFSDFTMFLELNLMRMIAMLLVVKFHESIKQEAKFTWNMQRALNMCFHVAVIFLLCTALRMKSWRCVIFHVNEIFLLITHLMIIIVIVVIC